MLSVANHRLDGTSGAKAVVWDPTSNHNNTITPKFLVFHYTACSYEVAMSTFKRTSGDNRSSVQLLVDSDGSVTQLVDLNKRAWHAGVSVWGELDDINSHSIGIEVVNYGYLLKTANNEFRLGNGKPAPFGAEEVVEARHASPAVRYSYWHAYTPQQIETCGELAQLLVAHYGLKEILGHDDIAPGRKVDPGPAFPMARMRSLAFSREAGQDSSELVYVTASRLNIRSGPGVEHPLAGSPLVQNTRLRVLGRLTGWVQAQAEGADPVRGWVSSDHVRPVLQ